ncbi:MAG: prepilin peptidase [Nitrospirae bacterium]|nr:MAG: prepilin peptidase [Nitrospirota bacterium]
MMVGLADLLFGFILGAVVGSFLNVCIYRIPLGQSILSPGSRCPQCAHPLSWGEKVPLLSFVFLRRRCRHCHRFIPWRYFFVELTNAIGYLALVLKFGWTGITGIYALFFSALVVITWIDLQYYIIPDVISLPGILVGLVAAATLLPLGLMSSVIGVLFGGGLLWMLAALSPYVFGKEGMGGGDIKLLAMIGAFVGWEQTFFTLLIAAVTGSLVGIGLVMMKRLRRGQYMPFGPFLAFGAVLSLFFHPSVVGWSHGWLL